MKNFQAEEERAADTTSASDFNGHDEVKKGEETARTIISGALEAAAAGLNGRRKAVAADVVLLTFD